ncbi:NADP-dependent oxidoreductase [Nocardia sp. NPDC051990]|uniref:NADP-dependent oxidoreductase n=1 Tax=Nocardia sp. NPDC051990 TaxID=3155285 RepID=UPI00341275A8
MARAMVFSAYGPPSVLHQIDVDAPQAGPGQVRVRVKTAGVNPVDYKMRRGDFADIAPARFPQTLGNEFAGVVDQVGNGVTELADGSQVLGFTSAAAYAEYVVVGADQITAKPAGMPWEAAGALSAAGQTAYNALRELRVATGETLLIHGASGGVGTMAVQLARSAGVIVVGTASPANHDHLGSLGAIPIAYGDGLIARARALTPNGIDAALDLAGGEAITASIALVTDKDRIGTTVDAEAAQKFGIRRLRGARSTQTLATLADLHTKGELQILISATYPLDQAAAAHHDLETGHVRGKIVLTTD